MSQRKSRSVKKGLYTDSAGVYKGILWLVSTYADINGIFIGEWDQNYQSYISYYHYCIKIDKLNSSLRIFKLIESSFISSLILLQFFLPPRYLQQTCRIIKLPLKFFHCECFLPGYDDNFNNTIGSKYLDYIDNDHMNNDNKYL